MRWELQRETGLETDLQKSATGEPDEEQSEETEPDAGLLEDGTLDPLDALAPDALGAHAATSALDMLDVFDALEVLEALEASLEHKGIDVRALATSGALMIGSMALPLAILGIADGMARAVVCAAVGLTIGWVAAGLGQSLTVFGGWSLALLVSPVAILYPSALAPGVLAFDVGLASIALGAALRAWTEVSRAKPALVDVARLPAVIGACHAAAWLSAALWLRLLDVAPLQTLTSVALWGWVSVILAAGVVVIRHGTGSALFRRWAAVAGSVSVVLVLPDGMSLFAAAPAHNELLPVLALPILLASSALWTVRDDTAHEP